MKVEDSPIPTPADSRTSLYWKDKDSQRIECRAIVFKLGPIQRSPHPEVEEEFLTNSDTYLDALACAAIEFRNRELILRGLIESLSDGKSFQFEEEELDRLRRGLVNLVDGVLQQFAIEDIGLFSANRFIVVPVGKRTYVAMTESRWIDFLKKELCVEGIKK
jgi:hypothetical protein